jgi:hypothetical protein
MMTTRFMSIVIASILGISLAHTDPYLPKRTLVRWPGHACIWEPLYREYAVVNVTPVSVWNNGADARLYLYCPLPFMEYDDAGEFLGVTAAYVGSSPKVSVYDGSDDATDGSIRARIYQFRRSSKRKLVDLL